jgi:hypothetical protein
MTAAVTAQLLGLSGIQPGSRARRSIASSNVGELRDHPVVLSSGVPQPPRTSRWASCTCRHERATATQAVSNRIAAAQQQRKVETDRIRKG